jgi:predicted ester cyclase
MSLDNQKNMSRRALDMWASDNSDRPEDIFAESYVNHQEPDVEGGISARSLGTWKELVSGYHTSFSDSRSRVLMQVANGDLVATRWEIVATHTGDFMGLAPTGTEATWTGVQIDRFEDGKIVESWTNWDKYRLFEELGLVN